MIYDLAGYELKTYRVVYYAEIGSVDGNGVGIWQDTHESVPHTSRKEAEATRAEWLMSGKLQKMSWGGFRPTDKPYGDFRIRCAEELTTMETKP